MRITDSPGADRQKTPRLLFAIRYFHPWIGGLEKNTYRLAQELSHRGVSVTVVTGRFFRTWLAVENHGLLKIKRLPSPRIKVLGAVVFLISLARYLITQRDSYDIVHAFQVGHTAAVAVLLSRMLGKPSVLTLAGGGFGGDIFKHRRTLLGRLVLRLCLQATRIVMRNRRMAEELAVVRCPDDRANFIPNGVDLHCFHPSQHTDRLTNSVQRTIVYIGRLSAEKGVAFLIRAHARLHCTLPARLLIVGDGPERKRLERMTRRLGIAHVTEFVGPADDVLPYLRQADVFVLPSQHEGMSNALLEAMACGVPVVATRVPGTEEVVEDGVTGLLVEYDDVDGMARALAIMLTDLSCRRACTQRALDCIRARYTFDHEVKHYLELYRMITEAAVPSSEKQPCHKRDRT